MAGLLQMQPERLQTMQLDLWVGMCVCVLFCDRLAHLLLGQKESEYSWASVRVREGNILFIIINYIFFMVK